MMVKVMMIDDDDEDDRTDDDNNAPDPDGEARDKNRYMVIMILLI